jgi:hypothetical protein
LTDGVDALVRDDPRGFADAVRSLMRDDALWARITDGARLRSREWAPEVAAESLHGLCREFISPHRMKGMLPRGSVTELPPPVS